MIKSLKSKLISFFVKKRKQILLGLIISRPNAKLFRTPFKHIATGITLNEK